MRAFYKAFPIWNALRTELSWTQYRLLCRLETDAKRDYYMQECIAGSWDSRTLQRQINSLAFERVLTHKADTAEPHLKVVDILGIDTSKIVEIVIG